MQTRQWFPFKQRGEKGQRRGQSFVEFAIIVGILLIFLSGLVEFGMWMLQYSNLVMASRNAARFALSNDYRIVNPPCQSNPRGPVCDPRSPSFSDDECQKDFYCKAALLAVQTLAANEPTVRLDPDAGDDVVISVFTLTEYDPAVVTDRHPDEDGWSFYGNQTSRFSRTDVKNLLVSQGVVNTSAGYVLVEIYYNYHQMLGLPWLVMFVPDPIPLHVYTFMPLYSAAPTPTPGP